MAAVPGISCSRSTPTRVGKTDELRPEYRRDEVHPHACGENYLSLTVLDFTRHSRPYVYHS